MWRSLKILVAKSTVRYHLQMDMRVWHVFFKECDLFHWNMKVASSVVFHIHEKYCGLHPFETIKLPIVSFHMCGSLCFAEIIVNLTNKHHYLLNTFYFINQSFVFRDFFHNMDLLFIKVAPSPSKRIYFICFIESPW